MTKSRGISRARRVSTGTAWGEGLHRQFMGAVDEFPDEGLDDLGLQVQAVFQAEGGDVLVAQVVAAVVALPGQVQEGGHDVGHHPVDVEGQGVSGEKAWSRPSSGCLGGGHQPVHLRKFGVFGLSFGLVACGRPHKP